VSSTALDSTLKLFLILPIKFALKPTSGYKYSAFLITFLLVRSNNPEKLSFEEMKKRIKEHLQMATKY